MNDPIRALTDPPLAVRALDLRRCYQVGSAEVRALRGIDLTVARGEFLSVVGVSGSGKSTLLHLLGGLDTPTDGRVLVDGQELNEMSEREKSLFRRQEVGFIFQAFHLIPTLTARMNVQVALTIQGRYGDERRRRASAALERVGLAKRAEHRPGQLSGGEQQRVAIARAIAHTPSLLLADEPTGNLDDENTRAVVALLREISRESGTTVVMVTHDEDLAREFSDRVIRMRDGLLLSGEGGAA